MLLFSLSKIVCPFTLLCFFGPSQDLCPKHCECYQSIGNTSSAVCGSLKRNDFSQRKLNTLALDSIRFDDEVLEEDLVDISFQHLTIEACGGAQSTMNKNLSKRGKLCSTDCTRESLTIINSRNIFDWKWPSFQFKHVLIDMSRLFAFKPAILDEQFIDNVVGRQVQSLTITNSHLAVIKQDAFRNTVKLKYLNLSYNKIDGFLPMSLDNETSIRYLNLKGNFIKYIDDQLFDRMPHLQELDLSSNQISFVGYSSLRPVWDGLTILDIRGNRFPCFVLCWIFRLKSPHPFPVDETDCYIGKSWTILRNVRRRKSYCA